MGEPVKASVHLRSTLVACNATAPGTAAPTPAGRHRTFGCGSWRMPGPKSWGGDKRRRKRPQTPEAAASASQDVGKVVHAKRQRNAAEPLKKRTQALSSGEKRLRALNKKLREIEARQERQSRGEALDAQQLCKLNSLDSVLSQMNEFMPS